MLITLLAAGSFLVVWLLVWWTDLAKRWTWMWYNSLFGNTRRQVEEERFIEESVYRMEADQRVVEAIYAQSQHHDSNPALLNGVLALIVPTVLAVELPVAALQTWWQTALALVMSVISIYGAITIVAGFRVMYQTIAHARLYGKVIDRYCENLHLPKRPR